MSGSQNLVISYKRNEAGEGDTNNDDVGPSDKSMLRSFRFHRARSIALRQDLNTFKSLKAGGAGNSLSLKKLKELYAYKLEKVLSDGTTAATKKKKGLTARSLTRAYMLYVFWSFLFPTKKVVWDPYRDKRDFAHAFKEVTFFYGALASPDHVQPYYPNRVVRQFNWVQGIPTKRLLTKVSNLWNVKEPRKFNPKYEWVDCFSCQKWKEFILKKADRGRRVREGPLVSTEAYLERFASVSWTTIYPITVELAEDNDVGIHQRKEANVNEHGDTPVHQSEDIAKQYDASTSECDLLKETIEQMKEGIELKCTIDEQYVLEFADVPRQLDAKILECKNLEEKNTSLETELRPKSGLEDCNQSLSVELNKNCEEIESLKVVNALLIEQIDLQLPLAIPLAVLQSDQPVPDTTLAKKYEDLLATHEDFKKKLIAKEDFRQKLVNAEERMKTLEVNNSEWAYSYGHQHVEYRHMAHLLSTYYEKVVDFISHTEAYTLFPLLWARKRNITSNEERFQNLLMDTSKYWWFGLGTDNHYVRLFLRFDAPIPPVSTIFYSHANLEILPAFLKEQMT
ncbi:hypothetical protein GIB67_021627, partial [Kingdonia uniflora]